LNLIRHSGESRNPEAACTVFVILDTGFRRYDALDPLLSLAAFGFSTLSRKA